MMDVLYHHGIKGQRWGVRQGPPYPLSPSDHTAAEKKSGGSSSKWKGNAEERFQRDKKWLKDHRKEI